MDDLEEELWAKCKKVIWPRSDYPISDNLKARLRHVARDGLKEGNESLLDRPNEQKT
jgi:hypothetical protein